MISVVIGINKVDRFTYAAIDSIICQTLKEIELVIVANGAEYESVASELESKYQTFSNVMIYKTPIGQLAYALNKGIELARFDLIARMDSDDISHPDRLSQQLKFMIEKNLDLVGCDINLIDEKDKLIGKRCYPKGNEINKLLPFRNPFAHNTILMKKEIIIKARGYNAGFNSEDYDLWLRLRKIGVKWDNLSDVLLNYRIHPDASQRRLLGYAESTALAIREFILHKNFINFCAVVFQFIKSFVRPKKK